MGTVGGLILSRCFCTAAISLRSSGQRGGDATEVVGELFGFGGVALVGGLVDESQDVGRELGAQVEGIAGGGDTKFSEGQLAAVVVVVIEGECDSVSPSPSSRGVPSTKTASWGSVCFGVTSQPLRFLETLPMALAIGALSAGKVGAGETEGQLANASGGKLSAGFWVPADFLHSR